MRTPEDRDRLNKLVFGQGPQRWWDSLPDVLKTPWLLPISGVILYALLRTSYSSFYYDLGLQPEDVGLGYAQILEQSIVILLILLVVGLTLAGIQLLIPDAVFHRRNLQSILLVSTAIGTLIPYVLIALLVIPFLRALRPTPELADQAGILGLFVVTAIGLANIRMLGVRKEDVARRGFERRTGHDATDWPEPPPQFILGFFAGIGSLVPRRITHHITEVGPVIAVIVAILTFGSITYLELFYPTARVAADVKAGRARHHVLFGLPAVSVGGDPATVYWPATPQSPSTPSTSPPKVPDAFQHCLMYLGQANGSTVLYDVNTKSPVRVPTNTIIVQTHPEWKGANCKP